MCRAWAALAAAVIGTACVTSSADDGPRRVQETALTPQPRPADSRPPEMISPPQAQGPFDPRAFMEGMVTPGECANAAKEMRARSPERGWAALKACIEKGKFPRADFTDLRMVLNGVWDDELATRPEVPQLLAKLIAMRGGDVDGDLLKFQQVRVPVFTLGAAIKQPQTYKGRYVIIRASLEDAQGQSATTARLVETSLSSQLKQAETEGKRNGSTSSSSGSYNGSLQTSKYGNFKGDATYDRSSSSRNTQVNVRYENHKTPTGRVALGRLSKPDPFLEPGKDYVFFARFDGVRQSPDDPEDGSPAGLVTIIAYFQPSALLID